MAISVPRHQTGTLYDWVTGPAAEQGTFRSGIGKGGVPYRISDGQRMDLQGRTLFEYDPRPNFDGNRPRLIVQPTRDNQPFLPTNWAGGKESPRVTTEYSCDFQEPNTPYGKCQPSSGTPGEGVRDL